MKWLSIAALGLALLIGCAYLMVNKQEDVIHLTEAVQAPSFNGLRFVGWYADEDFETPADLSDVTGDTDVYARYVNDAYFTVQIINTVSKKVVTKSRIVTVVVGDDKAAAKAKGRKGQNVRLTARLISTPDEKWDVRVEAHDEQESTRSSAREGAAELVQVLGITEELAAAMVASGFTTLQGIAEYVEEGDLVDALGITAEQEKDIIEKAKANC